MTPNRQPFAPGGEALSTAQRDAIRQASGLVNRAAQLVGRTRVAFGLSDTTGLELTELLSRLDLLMIRCDQFLAVHPER